jgi:hypothetical protein
LVELAALSNLWSADLNDTKVTVAGIAEFRKAMPNYIIGHASLEGAALKRPARAPVVLALTKSDKSNFDRRLANCMLGVQRRAQGQRTKHRQDEPRYAQKLRSRTGSEASAYELRPADYSSNSFMSNSIALRQVHPRGWRQVVSTRYLPSGVSATREPWYCDFGENPRVTTGAPA